MYWPSRRGGGQDIMSMADLKAQFLSHSQRTASQWLRKDTAKALFDARLAEYEQNGIAVSCAKPPDEKTVNAYHSALLSDPEIVQEMVRRGLVPVKRAQIYARGEVRRRRQARGTNALAEARSTRDTVC